MDDFRTLLTGWERPCNLEELTEEAARCIGGMYRETSAEEDLADARTIITEAREFERARIAAILRTHYDEAEDRVTFGDFESCSDRCPGIVMDHVLKLLEA